jgi:hypothetical protein
VSDVSGGKRLYPRVEYSIPLYDRTNPPGTPLASQQTADQIYRLIALMEEAAQEHEVDTNDGDWFHVCLQPADPPMDQCAEHQLTFWFDIPNQAKWDNSALAERNRKHGIS